MDKVRMEDVKIVSLHNLLEMVPDIEFYEEHFIEHCITEGSPSLSMPVAIYASSMKKALEYYDDEGDNEFQELIEVLAELDDDVMILF